MHDQHRLLVSLQAALAAEIHDVRVLIEELAEVLVGDEAFALANIEQLQGFDLIIQRADESARLLERIAGGLCPHQAVEQVRLTAVQKRLRAALRAA